MDKQKKLITEVMEADAKDGLYSQTAVEWFINNLPERFKNAIISTCQEEIATAKEMERQQQTQPHTPHHKFKDEWGNTDWRDTGEMGG